MITLLALLLLQASGEMQPADTTTEPTEAPAEAMDSAQPADAMDPAEPAADPMAETPPAAAEPAAEAAPAAEEEDEADDPMGEVICRRKVESGDKMGQRNKIRKVCKTREEWATPKRRR